MKSLIFLVVGAYVSSYVTFVDRSWIGCNILGYFMLTSIIIIYCRLKGVSRNISSLHPWVPALGLGCIWFLSAVHAADPESPNVLIVATLVVNAVITSLFYKVNFNVR